MQQVYLNCDWTKKPRTEANASIADNLDCAATVNPELQLVYRHIVTNSSKDQSLSLYFLHLTNSKVYVSKPQHICQLRIQSL